MKEQKRYSLRELLTLMDKAYLMGKEKRGYIDYRRLRDEEVLAI